MEDNNLLRTHLTVKAKLFEVRNAAILLYKANIKYNAK